VNITHFLPHKKQCLQLDLCVTGTARCYCFLKFVLGIINTILPAVKFFRISPLKKQQLPQDTNHKTPDFMHIAHKNTRNNAGVQAR